MLAYSVKKRNADYFAYGCFHQENSTAGMKPGIHPSSKIKNKKIKTLLKATIVTLDLNLLLILGQFQTLD